MIALPKIVELENGLFGYQYEDGRILGEYKSASEYDETCLTADVITVKDDRIKLDLYGNHIYNKMDLYDIIADKPEKFMYISTEIFANKGYIKKLIGIVKNDLKYKYSKWNTQTQEEKLAEFDEIIKAKYIKEAVNLVDYIERLQAWHEIVILNSENVQEDDSITQ